MKQYNKNNDIKREIHKINTTMMKVDFFSKKFNLKNCKGANYHNSCMVAYLIFNEQL